MKYLIFLFLASCQTLNTTEVNLCIEDQVRFYADLCGEEDTEGPDAHFNGVNCASEYIKSCIGI